MKSLNGHAAPRPPAPDTLAAEWESFSGLIRPDSPLVGRQLRIAFYAGARAALYLLDRLADGGRPALERLVAESDAFAARVARGEE